MAEEGRLPPARTRAPAAAASLRGFFTILRSTRLISVSSCLLPPSELIGLPRSINWRRSATAAGLYVSVGFGFLGTLLAARQLGPEHFGFFSIVLVATSFFQSLLDLTAEEALVKYGFGYATRQDWGRLRRLFRQAITIKVAGGALAGVVLLGLAPAANSIFAASGLTVPFLIAALLPLLQSPEGVASAALILHGRYDVRAWLQAASMALRMTGLGVGAHFGVTEAVVGLIVAQAAGTIVLGATALVVFRRFPIAPQLRLGEDRRGVLRFVLQSSVATGILSLRGALSPLLLGIVSNPTQVGFFRVAQAPQAGFTALTSPVRLILLTEQTRDWERGATGAVFTGIKRYTIAAFLLMAVAVPPAYVFMPDLVRFFYGGRYTGAGDAARLMLLAAAVLLVSGWTKSFPVSIGRPGLRILAHGIESAVVIPLVVVLGSAWDATGAAGAVLAGSAVFNVVWAVIVVRIRRVHPGGTEAGPVAAAREAIQS